MVEILKGLYVSKDTPEMAKPWYAKLAYERHWIGGVAYKKIPMVPTGHIVRSLASILNAPSPLFGLIPKRTTLSGGDPR